jgi:hypothetical protein
LHQARLLGHPQRSRILPGKKRWVIVVGKNDQSVLKLNQYSAFKFYYQNQVSIQFQTNGLVVKLERDSSDTNLLFGKKLWKLNANKPWPKYLIIKFILGNQNGLYFHWLMIAREKRINK